VRISRVAVDSLNFNYPIDGPDVPWKPVRVFDDGTHVLGASSRWMHHRPAPTMHLGRFALSPSLRATCNLVIIRA
jgi:hypothetical protein